MASITPLFSEDPPAVKREAPLHLWLVAAMLLSFGVAGYIVFNFSEVPPQKTQTRSVAALPSFYYEDTEPLIQTVKTKPNESLVKPSSGFNDKQTDPLIKTGKDKSKEFPSNQDTVEQRAHRIIAKLNAILKETVDEKK